MKFVFVTIVFNTPVPIMSLSYNLSFVLLGISIAIYIINATALNNVILNYVIASIGLAEIFFYLFTWSYEKTRESPKGKAMWRMFHMSSSLGTIIVFSMYAWQLTRDYIDYINVTKWYIVMFAMMYSYIGVFVVMMTMTQTVSVYDESRKQTSSQKEEINEPLPHTFPENL